jgi:hypothetical protein
LTYLRTLSRSRGRICHISEGSGLLGARVSAALLRPADKNIHHYCHSELHPRGHCPRRHAPTMRRTECNPVRTSGNSLKQVASPRQNQHSRQHDEHCIRGVGRARCIPTRGTRSCRPLGSSSIAPSPIDLVVPDFVVRRSDCLVLRRRPPLSLLIHGSTRDVAVCRLILRPFRCLSHCHRISPPMRRPQSIQPAIA